MDVRRTLACGLGIGGLVGSLIGQPNSFVNFETPVVHPVDLSSDGRTLAVCNLPAARLEFFDVSSGLPVALGVVPVGLDPVSVRFRTTNEVWVVNQISSSVNVVALDQLRVGATIQTAWAPADVIFAGSPERAFVSCSRADTVQVFDPASRQVVTNVTIDGDRPKSLAMSPDGRQVYVAIFESGNASTILAPPVTGFDTVPTSVVSHPAGPYGGMDPPPNKGNAFSPPINPALNSDLLPTGSLIVKRNSAGRWMDDNHGDWTEFVSGTNAALSGRPMGWDIPDRDLAIIDTTTYETTYAAGLMNICMAAAVNPVSGRIAVIGTDAINERRFEPNLRSTFLRVNLALVNPATRAATVVDLNPHLDYLAQSIPRAERDQSIGDPRGIVWNRAGTRAYVTGMGSRNLIVIDGNGHRIGAPFELGEGPTGLALDESRERLYVLNRFSATISVVDTSTPSELTQVALYDPTPIAVTDGRRHFYDTRRTSGLGHVACASCHVNGRLDRLAWDLGNPAGQMILVELTGSALSETFHPMKGPMVTQTLQDMRGNLHWRADRRTIEDFNVTFTDLMGADSMLTTNEMQEFKSFLGSMTFPPNRLRNFDNTLSTNLALPGHFGIGADGKLNKTPLPDGNPQAGLEVFKFGTFSTGQGEPKRCDVCHNGDSGLGVEGGPFLSFARNAGLSFKGAQLRTILDKIGMDRVGTSSRAGFGFLHDGRADTLTRFVADGLGLRGNSDEGVDGNQQIADMVAFLVSFVGGETHTGSDGDHDSADTVAAVGRQITVTNAVSDTLLQDMLQLSGQPFRGVDLIATGPGGVWMLNRDAGRFQTDRNGETISISNLLRVAEPSNPLTFMLIPEGAGAAYSVDRDGDGVFNRTEVELGLDPFEPLSRTSNSAPQLIFAWGTRFLKTHPGLAIFNTNISAFDRDEPPQSLTFSLTEDAPSAAQIDPDTGRFSWLVPDDEPPGDRSIAVRVRDNGFPPLDQYLTQTVTIVPLRLEVIGVSRFGQVYMTWYGLPPARYVIQSKDRLEEPEWTDRSAVITAVREGSMGFEEEMPASGQRFYRLRLVR